MYYKKLIGQKCYLSPIDINDSDKFVEWLNDLVLTVNLSLYPLSINKENEKEILKTLANDHNYFIIDKELDLLIGICGYLTIDHLHQSGEVGIFIGDKNYWSKGYGSEALSLLMDYGFKALNLHSIFLQVFDFNERAIKSYEKLGFKKIGVRRHSRMRNMKRHDVVLMDILVDEFYEKL